ncbi:hypothetical protein HUN39_10295 [Methylocystis sp. FS]|uniref:hypothetical protein n=1 Tax=Methylocystis silviterrae TaxID=2743612 RepID=UPI001582FD7B|nr:hypothetical protein [Methylocystis silviterrae]NUJ80409.1 hypothetical protein [Methylocystis silviterrae]
MDLDRIERGSLVQNLRRALPLSAHPKQALIAFLRERGVVTRGAPRLVVLDIFDAGAAGGLMCRFAIAEDGEASSFIAPLTQVALYRRHPGARSRVVRRRKAPPPGAA